MNLKLRFELKSAKNKKKLIYLIGSYGYFELSNGAKKYQRLKISTGHSIEPQYWDKIKMRANRQYVNKYGHDLNSDLNQMESEVLNIYRKFEIDGHYPSPKQLKQAYKDSLTPALADDTTDTSIAEYIKNYISKEEGKTLNKKSKRTLNKYWNILTKINNYEENLGRKLYFEVLSADDYNGFFEFCNLQFQKNNGQGMSANYLSEIQKWVHKFLNQATKDGISVGYNINQNENKFKSEVVDHIYLTLEELHKIWKYDVSRMTKGYQIARDLFIIMALTGLRYDDLNELDNVRIQEDDGFRFASVFTKKTKKMVVIPIFKPVLEIYKQYDNSFPPIQASQTIRRYIKHIARLCEITEEVNIAVTRNGRKTPTVKEKCEFIGCHTARRSFISNALKMKVPETTIAQITHPNRTKSVFETYNKVSPIENNIIFQKLVKESSNTNWLFS